MFDARASTPAATGATSREPAVATFSAWTSPMCREGPPTGVNSSIGTEIRSHGPGRELHSTGRGLVQIQVVEPGGVVTLRMVETVVVEAPAGLRAGQRGARGHLRAVADEGDLGAAHQLVRGTGAHLGDVVVNLPANLQRVLGRLVVGEVLRLAGASRRARTGRARSRRLGGGRGRRRHGGGWLAPAGATGVSGAGAPALAGARRRPPARCRRRCPARSDDPLRPGAPGPRGHSAATTAVRSADHRDSCSRARPS